MLTELAEFSLGIIISTAEVFGYRWVGVVVIGSWVVQVVVVVRFWLRGVVAGCSLCLFMYPLAWLVCCCSQLFQIELQRRHTDLL